MKPTEYLLRSFYGDRVNRGPLRGEIGYYLLDALRAIYTKGIPIPYGTRVDPGTAEGGETHRDKGLLTRRPTGNIYPPHVSIYLFSFPNTMKNSHIDVSYSLDLRPPTLVFRAYASTAPLRLPYPRLINTMPLKL